MNKQSPPVVFTVRAEKALFTRPDLRVERFTYPVPTFGALAGVLRSIYAKPAFYWVPRRVLVVKPIKYQNLMVNEVGDPVITKKPFVASARRVQKMQTYLYDVHYVVEAHFEWSGKTPEDQNFPKHWDIFRRSLETGGRRDVFLGTRECTAVVGPEYVLPLDRPPKYRGFDEIASSCKSGLCLHVGLMFHSWDWGTAKDGFDTPCFFIGEVKNGVLEYPHPEDRERVIRQRFKKRGKSNDR